MFRAALNLRAVRVAAVIQLLFAIVLCFVPLFDVLGLERAFATGLISAPLGAAIGIALLRNFDDLEAAGAIGALLFALLLLPAIAAGLLVELVQQPCSPGQGLGFLVLLAYTSSLFCGAIGAASAAILKRRAGWLVAAFFAASFSATLWRLYYEPQIFAFSMPFGYWPGSLYDEEVHITGALWAHRGLTLLTTLAIFSLVRAAKTKLTSAKIWAALFIAAAISYSANGETLGFDLDRGSIERALRRHVVLDEIELYVDPSVTEEELNRIVEDHRLRLRQVTAFLGLKPAQRFTSFVYRDLDQKRALMGAAVTQIARPWSGEIHIDGFDTPHRVVKHELVHVVAADLAGGLFKVPTELGVVVNLAIVEGTAVAVDWPARGMTMHQWAAAMRSMGLAPNLRTALYPTGFWRESAARAYTAAGSFLRWLIDQRGLTKFKLLYQSGDFEQAYETSLDQLVTEWEQFLDQQPIDEQDRLRAEHRFRQPGIFSRVCPHTTASLAQEAFEDLMQGDLQNAATRFERVLEYDPGRSDVLIALSRAHAERNQIEEARTFAERALQSAQSTARGRIDAVSALADLEWRAGKKEAAAAGYRTILAQHLSEDGDRLQLVKLEALSRPPEIEGALMRYLTEDLPAPRALVLLSELTHAHPEDVLLHYLYGKRLEGVAPVEGVREMSKALEMGLPAAPIVLEAKLSLGRMLVRAGRPEEAEVQLRAIAETSSRAVVAIEALDWAERAVLAKETRGIVVDRAPFER